MGFVLEYTATWCGPCGSWGVPKAHKLYELGDVISICVHASGDTMYNASLCSSFLAKRTDSGGIPSFWVIDKHEGDTPQIDSIKLCTPEAGVTLIAEQTGNVMDISTRTEFFKKVTGQYYLSVYILESGIPGVGNGFTQNGQSDPDFKHDFVLRTAATPNNAYGEKIASGSISAGSTVDKQYMIPIDAKWKYQVYVAAVLWRYDQAKDFYYFVNAWDWGNHETHKPK